MDFAALVAAESGTVNVLEFTWPPPSPEQESYQCLGYVVMLRVQGFLLCVPEGFLTAEELEQGQQATPLEGIGPSCTLEATPVALSAGGEWEVPALLEPVPAVIVDLSESLVSALMPADLSAAGLYVFREGDAVQQLANQQVAMMDLMTAITNRLDALTKAQEPQALPQTAPPGLPSANPTAKLLQQPLSAAPLKSLASVLGGPPPVRTQPPAASHQPDRDAHLAQCIGSGELQRAFRFSSGFSGHGPEPSTCKPCQPDGPGSADPLLEVQPGLGSSVGGSVGRAKLQSELLSRSGSFAQAVRLNMSRTWTPLASFGPIR